MQLSIPLLSSYYIVNEYGKTEDKYNDLLKDLPVLQKVKEASKFTLNKTKEDQFFQIPKEKYEAFYKACSERCSLMSKILPFSLARCITGIALATFFLPSPLGILGLGIAIEGIIQSHFACYLGSRMHWHATKNTQEELRFDYVGYI
jgi:hypothetical protein